MEIIARTERLTLRRFDLTDAEAMHALNGDPEVTRYVGDPPFESVDAARDFVTGYLRDVALPEGDLSRWAVVENETGDVLGFCGLRRQADGTVDLGYRLLRRAWGQGYATEAARATLEVGFGRFGLSVITAHADVENLASLRVLEKLGMTFRAFAEHDGRRVAFYEISRG
jgi:ribosomal-protein-alanine N-acetyltransferase